MTLKERISQETKAAMRAKEVLRRDTLRMIHAALRYVEIDSRKTLDDEGVLEVLAKEAKKRREAIEHYQNAGRQDLVDKETAELKVIEDFLPRQLSRDEILVVVRQAVQELGATQPSQLGLVMKEVLPRVKGQADGKLVSQVVREVLAGS